MAAMPAITATASTITTESVAGDRSLEAERLRRLPPATVDDLIASGFADLLVLVPARCGGSQGEFQAILDPVRRMAHGCASSAWTIGCRSGCCI